MRLYSIEVSWTSYGTMYVEANNKDEALQKASGNDSVEIVKESEGNDYNVLENTIREEVV